MVEDIIRTTKSVFETRPVYHKRDETVRGHVFCSFLALVLKQELESRLKQAELAAPTMALDARANQSRR
jgi:transposase